MWSQLRENDPPQPVVAVEVSGTACLKVLCNVEHRIRRWFAIFARFARFASVVVLLVLLVLLVFRAGVDDRFRCIEPTLGEEFLVSMFKMQPLSLDLTIHFKNVLKSRVSIERKTIFCTVVRFATARAAFG